MQSRLFMLLPPVICNYGNKKIFVTFYYNDEHIIMTIILMNQEKILSGPHPDLLEAGGEKSQGRETRAKLSGEGSQVSSVVTVIRDRKSVV